MANKQLSYDFQNIKRDLGPAFETIITKNPVFTSLVSLWWPATSTKHERLEDVTDPVQTQLDWAYTAADGSITVDSTAGFKVWDILDFENASTWARSTLIAKVTAVTSATVLAISVYGGSTDENLPDNSIVFLQSRPKNEATDADPDAWYEPTVEYNYTQIFDRTAKLSLTNINVDKYGIAWGLNYEVEKQLQQIAYELVISSLRSPRVERSSTEAGTMWGLLRFLQQATGNKLDVGWALTEPSVNEAMELAHANGAMGISTILAHPVQWRKVSAFVSNYRRVNVDQGTTMAWTFVQQFMSDSGDILNIVMDRHMDKDKIALIDPSKVALVPLQNRQFSDKDATAPGADYVSRRVIWEYTMQVNNAANAHVLMTGLTV